MIWGFLSFTGCIACVSHSFLKIGALPQHVARIDQINNDTKLSHHSKFRLERKNTEALEFGDKQAWFFAVLTLKPIHGIPQELLKGRDAV